MVIRLTRYTHYEPPTYLPIRRLLVGGIFEPDPAIALSIAFFFDAIVDIGSPYAIIPHAIHRRCLQIYRDLGRQPYRVTGGNLLQQPFAEVGLRFLVTQPALAYQPATFLRVKAYLLEPNVAPSKVVIGLDTIEQHFTLYVPPPKDAFLLEPGDAIP